MAFEAGQTVVRRYFRSGQLIIVQCLRVIADDDRGLSLWMPAGTTGRSIRTVDGRAFRDMPRADWHTAPKLLVEWTTQRYDILMLMPPGAAHAISWIFDAGAFTGWYVNLESPAARWPLGVDLVDHDLDIRVQPDLSWAWKDEDEFAAATAEGLDWTPEQAVGIRAEGERVLALVDAGRYPFDGTGVDFAPDPAWTVPVLPEGWDA